MGKIREANEREMQDKCDEIEYLQLKYDSFNIRREVSEVVGKYNARTVNKLVHSEEKFVVDSEYTMFSLYIGLIHGII